MKAKPAVLRERARRDVDEIVAYDLAERAKHAAMGFIDALESACARLGRQPAMGSPRHALELELPGLRCWQVARYPQLIFYAERADHLDIWRVLHGQRHLPAWMQAPEGS